jgi:hypothetical protein
MVFCLIRKKGVNTITKDISKIRIALLSLVIYSATDLLQLSSQLSRNISRMDPYRIDMDLLFFELCAILSAKHIRILKEGTSDDKKQFIQQILFCTYPLPFDSVKRIILQLEMITNNDKEIRKQLERTFQERKQQFYWNRYKVVLALLAAVLACICIYLAAH